MNPFKQFLCSLFVSAAVYGQGLDPTVIGKPLGTTDDWPTYGGDYSGKRYSALKQLNPSTVKNLTLGWSTRLIAG